MPKSDKVTWYHYCLNDIRKSRKHLSPLDKKFMSEIEFVILSGKRLDERLEDYLMCLYRRCTEIGRIRR